MRPDPHDHLDERALLAALDADADEGLPAPDAAHLAVCTPCWLELEALRRTRRALRALPDTPASPDLFARAMASRAAGRRVALEATSTGRRLRDALPWAAPLLLAASVAVAVVVPKVLPVFGAAEADSVPVATAPAAPPYDQGDPIPMGRTYRWEYRVINDAGYDGASIVLSRDTDHVLLVSRGSQHGAAIFDDSVWISRETRTSVRQRGVQMRGAIAHPRITRELIGGDTLVSGNGPTRDTLIAESPAVEGYRLLSRYDLLAHLFGTRLDRTWSRRFYRYARQGGGLSLIERVVRVTGEETITVPAGTWRTWVIDVGGGGQRFWLRQTDGVMLREQFVGEPSRLELLRESTLSP